MTQHMDALAEANSVRMAGARFRREVAALDQVGGLRRLADELDAELSRGVGSLTIAAFLRGARYMGHRRAERFLRAASLVRKPNVRMRDLTTRERNALAATLRAYEADLRAHGRAA